MDAHGSVLPDYWWIAGLCQADPLATNWNLGISFLGKASGSSDASSRIATTSGHSLRSFPESTPAQALSLASCSISLVRGFWKSSAHANTDFVTGRPCLTNGLKRIAYTRAPGLLPTPVSLVRLRNLLHAYSSGQKPRKSPSPSPSGQPRGYAIPTPSPRSAPHTLLGCRMPLPWSSLACARSPKEESFGSMYQKTREFSLRLSNAAISRSSRMPRSTSTFNDWASVGRRLLQHF